MSRWSGLMPSDAGQPGGKRTGERMTHYVIKGGRFSQVCGVLLASGLGISWADRAGEEEARGKKKKPTRVKYTCPGCDFNAWAKPDAPLVCGDCELPLEPQG